MTLKIRNRFFIGLFCLFVLQGAFNVIVFSYRALGGGVRIPENAVRPLTAFAKMFPLAFPAVVAGVFFFMLYACVCTVVVYLMFEKTQAVEISFFSGFLIGCCFEGVRLFIGIEDFLPSSLSVMLMSRIVLSGRILCPLSLLFAVLLRESEEKQNFERNFLIMLIVSSFLGMTFPLNSLHMSTTCTILCGYRSLLQLFNFFLFLTTALTLFMHYYQSKSYNAALILAGYVILFFGYITLCNADNYVLLTAGVTMLSAGTMGFLKGLHLSYLWK